MQQETATLITVRYMTLFLAILRSSIPLIFTGLALVLNIDSISQKLTFYTDLISTAVPLYFINAYDSIKTLQIISCYTFPCKFNYISMEKFYWLIVRTPVVVLWYTTHILYTLIASPLIDLYVVYLSAINLPVLRQRVLSE